MTDSQSIVNSIENLKENEFDPFDINKKVTYSSDDEDPECTSNNPENQTESSMPQQILDHKTDISELVTNLDTEKVDNLAGTSSNSLSANNIIREPSVSELHNKDNSANIVLEPAKSITNNLRSDNSSDGDSSSSNFSDDESTNSGSSSDVEDILDRDLNDVDEFDELDEEGADDPPRTKNEIIDFQVPSLPVDYTIEDQTKIQLVGYLSGVVEKNVLIKSLSSAEERVLSEGTVFCLEDRTPIGLLFEVFGKLQAPIYSIKYNTVEEALKWVDKKGENVYFVVPTAEYLSTFMIRKMKGTDASNFNDEEIPEDEQEFSDDEKEAAAKKNKKRKKKSAKVENDLKIGESNKKVKKANLAAIISSQPKDVESVKSRLTSLPSKSSVASNSTMPSLQASQCDNMVLMQQFMNMMQQATQSTNQYALQEQHRNHYSSVQGQPYSQYPAVQGGFSNQYFAMQGQHASSYAHQNSVYSQNPSHYPYSLHSQYVSSFSSPANAAMNTQTVAQFNSAVNDLYNTNYDARSHNPVQNNGNNLDQAHFEMREQKQNIIQHQSNENNTHLIAQLAEAVAKNPAVIEKIVEKSITDNKTEDEYDPTA